MLHDAHFCNQAKSKQEQFKSTWTGPSQLTPPLLLHAAALYDIAYTSGCGVLVMLCMIAYTSGYFV